MHEAAGKSFFDTQPEGADGPKLRGVHPNQSQEQNADISCVVGASRNKIK